MIKYFVVGVLAVTVLMLIPSLQHLLHIASGYSAKMMCTGIFMSQRSYSSIFENELGVGHSNILIGVSVHWDDYSVSTSVLGMGPMISELLHLPVRKAVYLGPKYGCQLEVENFNSVKPKWDRKNRTDISTEILPVSSSHNELDIKCVRNIISYDFGIEAAKQNQTRAIVVRHEGEVVAEGYQEVLGITAETPLLGWSMTKSVFGVLVGVAIQEGLLELDTHLELRHMNASHKQRVQQMNGNQPLTFRDLLGMSDVLAMEEDYGITREVVSMLYGAADMMAFVAQVSSHSLGAPPTAAGGSGSGGGKRRNVTNFGWYYSSAVSNLLSTELRHRFRSDEEYWAFPHVALFDVIGATSFALEMDPSGTFVASSFGYASGRDWALLGELLLREGLWGDRQVLPSWYVRFLQTPNPASGGHYGGQIWLNAARVRTDEYNRLPLSHDKKVQCEWMTRELPPDAYYMSGHDGQFVFIIPSRKLVITRLGFTHDKGGSIGYAGWNLIRFFSDIVNTCSR
jgi:CubicO group peptidase (beta-lactamase class C family)